MKEGFDIGLKERVVGCEDKEMKIGRKKKGVNENRKNRQPIRMKEGFEIKPVAGSKNNSSSG